VNVGSSGVLAGHGTIVGAVTIGSGGTLMPGGSAGTLTVNGALTFNPGALYAVQLGGGGNSNTVVTGTATLNGAAVAINASGPLAPLTPYTILQAGQVSGTFGPVTFNGSLTGVRNPHLTYDATDVFVSFDYGALLPLLPQNADANSVHVATSIDDFTGNGGALPSSFQNLLTLQGPALAGALDHLAGETNAGFLQGAFQAGNAFLSLLLNPYADNRGSGGFGPAPAFAPAEPSRLPRAAAAFASVAPQAQTFDRRFGIWGSAYGGSGTTDGNAAAGSHTTTSQVFGLAAGVDRRVDPDTVLGFALAGGGMSWGLDAGLGGGHSDLFQAGAYGTRRLGPAYVSGALAYGFNAVTTNRTVTVAGTDRLTADFRTSSIGARIESGYRLAGPGGGITPYAAAQVQSIFLPAYAETASAGSAQFALAIGAQTATAARSEIGAWVDKSIALDAGALITVYARAAWAHDFGTAPAASATFQSLPGVSFIVDGAAPARDGALATAGAQWRGPDGWSVTAKFDGEFSSTTSIYAGSGVLRKEW
jgi:outer membrane autotransporter protein